MKKFGKFIAGTLSLAAIAGGVFYFLKNVVNKDSTDDFDDFDDDFDDIDEEEMDDSEEDSTSESRGYVTLTMPEASDSINNEEEKDSLDDEEDLADDSLEEEPTTHEQ